MREQIRQSMERQGITQVMLAERLGTTQPEVSAQLRDSNPRGMTEQTAMKYADALGEEWYLRPKSKPAKRSKK